MKMADLRDDNGSGLTEAMTPVEALVLGRRIPRLRLKQISTKCCIHFHPTCLKLQS